MLGGLKSIRDKITKPFQKHGKAKTPAGCIANSDLDVILVQAKERYPEFPVWDEINHPRDNYFTIHVLPLLMPLHEGLKGPMQDLKNQMLTDGAGIDLRQLRNAYEERFSHLWVAEMQRWTYRPIGITTFLRESGPNSRDNWWLSMTWLNLAQRNHQVLRNTVEYFQVWHPGFIVARDHPIVNRSLKNYPEHLRGKEENSMIWE